MIGVTIFLVVFFGLLAIDEILWKASERVNDWDLSYIYILPLTGWIAYLKYGRSNANRKTKIQ